jgi:predicted transcriptional regulator
LDRLATQLKSNKSAVCRRAIQRILAVVKKNFEDGKYKDDVEAEADFRRLVDRDEGCK